MSSLECEIASCDQGHECSAGKFMYITIHGADRALCYFRSGQLLSQNMLQNLFSFRALFITFLEFQISNLHLY